MLGNTLARATRFAGRRGTRVGALVPRSPVSRAGPPSAKVEPVLEPVYVTLTPALKRGSSDPSADSNVAVLDPTVFKHPIRRDILHLCVVHYRDSLRQGSANTKTRGEVRGSGRKVRQQKGSGKARMGDAQSPILRSGGVAFGPKPRDFSTKLPRKVIEMGYRVVLSSKLRDQRLGVMSCLQWPHAKTKTLAQRIDSLGLRKTLFVTGESQPHAGLERAIRNIPNVDIITTAQANVYELLRWPRVVLDFKAVEHFEEMLKKDTPVNPVSVLEAEAVPAEGEVVQA